MVRERGFTPVPRLRTGATDLRPLAHRASTGRNAATTAEVLERRTLLASVAGTAYRDADNDGTMDAGESPIVGMTVYDDVNGNNQFDPGTVDFGYKGNPRTIPDLGTVNIPIVVSGVPGNVTDVNVVLDITHSWSSDLVGTLISPLGTNVLLFSRVGDPDNGGEGFLGTILDDEGEFPITKGIDPFTWTYQPQEFLSKVDGEPINGTWTLRIRDAAPGDDGFVHTWGLTFAGPDAEPSTQTDFEGNYVFDELSAGNHRIRMVIPDGESQTQPANNGSHVVTLTANQALTGRNFGLGSGTPAVSVVGRHVFYNNSAFDNRDPAAGAADDAAVATDKEPLLPGAVAGLGNYTNYSRGINGVMVDISNLPSGANLSASDFLFAVGNDDNPAGWSAPSAEPTIDLRRGAGVNGSDRITLTWPDGTIVGKWLQVTVQPGGNTGLENADVFYFGNLPGETGNSLADARVTAADVLATRANTARSGVTAENDYDFNRDARVDVYDQAIARSRLGRSLVLLGVPVPAAPARISAGVFSNVAVSRAVRAPYRPLRALDETPAGVL